jgi:glutathione S-transferase/endonuclease YncB( thermonuclease family)
LTVVLALLLVAAVRFLGLDRPDLIEGRPRISDGDSLVLVGQRIRLLGLDAPELLQTCTKDGQERPCGEAARQKLREIVGAAEIRCETEGRDRYGRLLARCYVDGEDIGAKLVGSGWALSTDDYGLKEAAARIKGEGLWSMDFTVPAEWRAEQALKTKRESGHGSGTRPWAGDIAVYCGPRWRSRGEISDDECEIMKLIDGGRAPNPRRVRIFLAEKGIEIPLQPLDIGALEQKDESFRAINPMQRVPVLILDDGTAISESVAICRYFEEIQPEPPLMGTDPLDKALVEMWNRRMELNLMAGVAAAFRHLHPAMREMEVPQVPEWGEANKAKVMDLLKWLDEELAGRRFIAGDRFTIADITALVAVDFMKPAKLAVPEDHANLRRWHEEVSSRPSASA